MGIIVIGCRVPPSLKSDGECVGINFTGKCDYTPNTLKAHALLEYAKVIKGGALQNDFQEVLFKVGVIELSVVFIQNFFL